MDSFIERTPRRRLHNASSFLNVTKKVSATALSWGLPDTEKGCLTPHCLKSAANVLEVYCFPGLLWKVSPSGRSLSLNTFLNVAVTRFVLGFWDT